jgi:hypothetical protein
MDVLLRLGDVLPAEQQEDLVVGQTAVVDDLDRDRNLRVRGRRERQHERGNATAMQVHPGGRNGWDGRARRRERPARSASPVPRVASSGAETPARTSGAA